MLRDGWLQLQDGRLWLKRETSVAEKVAPYLRRCVCSSEDHENEACSSECERSQRVTPEARMIS
jgi:hypothetical protein